MLHIEAKIQVKPDLVETFLTEVDLVVQGSLSEAGNHGYELVRSVSNNSTFYLLEKWADETAIQSHNATAHYKRFKKNVPKFLAVPIEVDLLKS
ncbi:putative quinol monooxygenase [Listeria cossartiae subsp. cayugensis]|uniref:putative quinol monooxygenase n=1 Tax=Listeria cossartiae TaxID=2838249 RepID=UPI0028801BFC|nr:putative quinol monooxygenase [Listeria cossartiae]MDT0001509.1 putative quinol monooxygenase [Listeria cossartiae subsp. cayugensis]MDT0004299.1 putative quinol monooxygenase [Listeria cossartiae subsp. cayugensis]MDT0009708.1 putative quinol monooxygenase [Listeria cossartiae subsp. cayugensis]MDT0015453.1 putative quinol monooxygenase [Listeria cossartiae subsp. cayugensis]MDT0020860.1 putative quinol monooxygenase [Listeria cossartiae subsp. cayugensis]